MLEDWTEEAAKPSRARALSSHLAGLALFTALALWFTWPIPTDIRNLSGAYGDGPMFLWNLWWFRHTLDTPGASLFHTDYIFHPVGADLYLHTLTPARGAMALPFLPLGTVAANNVLYLLSFVLGGYFTALLARRLVRWWPAAWLAGVVYSFSAFHLARGNGHFNLTEIQWLPLYLLVFLRAIEERAPRFVALAGLVLLFIAYVDLYYLVFGALLSVVYLVFRSLSLADLRWLMRPAGGRLRWLDGVLLVLVASIVVVFLVSGFEWDLGFVKIRAHGFDRPLRILFAGLALKAWLIGRRDGLDARGWMHERLRDVGTLAVVGAITVVGFAPVLLGIRAQMREGGDLLKSNADFHRQFAANLQGFLLPEDLNPGYWQDDWRATLWPPSEHLLTSGIEGCTYLGGVALVLALFGLRAWPRRPAVRFAALFALVFLNLSFGPSLHVGDLEFWRANPHSHLLLFNWIRDLPVLGAVRVTSRFALVVQLAVALLAAFGIAELTDLLGRGRRGRQQAAGVALAAIALVAWDVYPGRFVPRFLAAPEGIGLIGRDQRPGTVLELPLSWSSGTDALGARDFSFFFHQTVHGRPIFSGHASRYPPTRLAKLSEQPLLGNLMAIQRGLPVLFTQTERDRAFARKQGIRWVVVNWPLARHRRTMVRYLRSVFDLTEVYGGDRSTVFEVAADEPQPSGGSRARRRPARRR